MRFAAVQIPAKIGVRSLNGEKLDVLNASRTSSDSSPFFTLSRRRFLHAVIYKAARGADLPLSFHALGVLTGCRRDAIHRVSARDAVRLRYPFTPKGARLVPLFIVLWSIIQHLQVHTTQSLAWVPAIDGNVVLL